MNDLCERVSELVSSGDKVATTAGRLEESRPHIHGWRATPKRRGRQPDPYGPRTVLCCENELPENGDFSLASIVDLQQTARHFLATSDAAWDSWCRSANAFPNVGLRLASLRAAFGFFFVDGVPDSPITDRHDALAFYYGLLFEEHHHLGAAVDRLRAAAEFPTASEGDDAVRNLLLLTISHRDEAGRTLETDAACQKTQLKLAEWRRGLSDSRPFTRTQRLVGIYTPSRGFGPWDTAYHAAIAQAACSPAAPFYLQKLEALRVAYRRFCRHLTQAADRGYRSTFAMPSCATLNAALQDALNHRQAARPKPPTYTRFRAPDEWRRVFGHANGAPLSPRTWGLWRKGRDLAPYIHRESTERRVSVRSDCPLLPPDYDDAKPY